MDSYGSLNYKWALSLIHYISLHGVSEAIISPGSRSTPLALACEKHPAINTWIQIDERSAAFFALGIAQKQHKPVILICTSGSAVANWLPAVVEANYSYTPLLLLSADRPAELHHCGANQTIEQQGIFSSHVRESLTLEDASEILLNNNYLQQISSQIYHQAMEPKPGPVHLNIPLREPLLPKRFTSDDLNHFINQLGVQILNYSEKIVHNQLTSLPISSIRLELLNKIISSGHGLIICGRLSFQEQTEFAPILAQLSVKLSCPILIDPLSGLRLTTLDHSHFVYNYDHFLKQYKVDDNSLLKPDWIIRFGQFPVSKNLMLYLQSLNTHTILVSSYGDTLDPIHKANTEVHCLPALFCQQLLSSQQHIATSIAKSSSIALAHWQEMDKHSEDKIHQHLSHSENTQLFEGHVIKTMLEFIPENSLVYSGNSMAIRDFDTFITQQSSAHKNIDFFANRGVSGIDGNISTFFGLLASQAGNNSQYGVAVVGDLTFYHDMNGLLICKQLSTMGINATIILINNSGGGIFNYLPQQPLDSFDKLWTTDTGLDFQYSAKLYGLNYHKINTHQECQKQLAEVFTLSGIQLVEIIIDQQISVECHKRI